MDEVRRYELFVIFQPELDDEQLETRIDRVTGYLTGIGGQIVEIARRGKRRLAYPINRFTQGIDVLYQANVPGNRLDTLERQLNLYEDVIRYLIVRRDDLDKQARQAAAASAAAATTSQPEAPVFETPQPVEVGTPVGETVAADTDEVDTSAAGTVSPTGEAEGSAPVGIPAEDQTPEPTTATASDVPVTTEE